MSFVHLKQATYENVGEIVSEVFVYTAQCYGWKECLQVGSDINICDYRVRVIIVQIGNNVVGTDADSEHNEQSPSYFDGVGPHDQVLDPVKGCSIS